MKWTYHVSASIVFSYYGLKQVRGLHASSSKKSGRWLFRANTVAWDCPQGTSLLLSLRSTLLSLWISFPWSKDYCNSKHHIMFQVVKRWKDKRLFLSSTLLEKEPFLPRYFNLYPINRKLSRAHAYTVLEIWGSLSGLYCRGWKFITVNGEQKNTPPA